MKLAVQLYSLRNDYTNGEEFLEILGKVKEIGFDGVEFAGFAGVAPEVIKARLDELGLVAVGCHIGLDDLKEPKLEETVKNAKALGMKIISITGANDSLLSEISDVTIKIPENETYKIQELTLPVYHALCADIEEAFFG